MNSPKAWTRMLAARFGNSSRTYETRARRSCS
ncbi:UNVERIFIED_CONTAM: hypothetical protein GTU68_051405 [Idotea baltica]|nr:hypothetical protein [Idotea baltica]